MEQINLNEKNNIATVTKSENFSLQNVKPGEISEALRENLGGEEVTSSHLEKISLPTGGYTHWRLADRLTGEEMHKEDFNGIIIHQQTTRAYWEGEFSGGGTLPECSSLDGVRGVGDPGGPCDVCPYNQFGSKGRGKKCRESKQLLIRREKATLPSVLQLPPSSLWTFRNFSLNLAASGVKLYEAIVRFSLSADKNSDGIKYSKLHLQFVNQIPTEQAENIKMFRDAFITAFVANKLNDEGSKEPIDHPWEETETSQDDGDSLETDDLPF